MWKEHGVPYEEKTMTAKNTPVGAASQHRVAYTLFPGLTVDMGEVVARNVDVVRYFHHVARKVEHNSGWDINDVN